MQALISRSPKRVTRAYRAVGLGIPSLIVASLLAGPARATDPATCSVVPGDSRLIVHVGTAGLFKFAGHEHTVEVPIREGHVDPHPDDPGRSSLRLVFAAKDAVVVPEKEPAGDAPKVQEKMRGPEVLDVARFPEAFFVSSRVTAERASGSRWKATIEGSLTLRGRAHPVKVEVDVDRAEGRLVAEGRFRLRQTDFGIDPVSVAGVVKVKNELDLEAHVVASCPGS